jgi:D-glycero-alpha-D-manno-heptose-7-phosphate kinase
MFFVGYTRQANVLLQEQQQRSEQGDAQMLEGLRFIKELGYEIKSVLEAGKIYCFGELMHQHWLRKRKRSAGMSNDSESRSSWAVASVRCSGLAATRSSGRYSWQVSPP